MNVPATTILIIDDSEGDRMLMREMLRRHGASYEVLEARNLTAAREILTQTPIDCIVLDFIIDMEDGLDFLMELTKKGKRRLPIVFVTGYDSPELAEDSQIMGASSFIAKSDLTPQRFIAAIAAALKSSSSI